MWVFSDILAFRFFDKALWGEHTMWFEDDRDRMRHKQARLFPKPIWDDYFKHHRFSNECHQDEISIFPLVLMQVDVQGMMARLTDSDAPQLSERERLKIWFAVAYGHQNIITDEQLLECALFLNLPQGQCFLAAVAYGKPSFVAKWIARQPHVTTVEFTKALHYAVVGGHLEVLNQLILFSQQAEEPIHLKEMLIDDRDGLFRVATDPLVIQRLTELAEKIGCTLPVRSASHEYINAVWHGKIEVFDKLLLESTRLPRSRGLSDYFQRWFPPEPPPNQVEVKALLEGGRYARYELFRAAITAGHSDIFDRLVALAQVYGVHLEPMLAICREDFQFAARRGHLSVIKKVLVLTRDYQVDTTHLMANDLLWDIETEEHLQVAEHLFDDANQNHLMHVKAILEYAHYSFLRMVSTHRDLKTVIAKINLAVEVGVDIQEMLPACFRSAVRGGRKEVVHFMVTTARERDMDISAMGLDDPIYPVLKSAIYGGHLDVVNYLIPLMERPGFCLRDRLKEDDFRMIGDAAERGHLDVFNRFIECLPDSQDIKAALERENYGIFAHTFHGGHLGMLSRLVSLALIHQVNLKEAIENCTRWPSTPIKLELVEYLLMLIPVHQLSLDRVFVWSHFFDYAAMVACIEVVSRLLQFSSVFAYAEVGEAYLASYISPIIQEKMQKIREQQATYVREGGARFDLFDAEEICYYYYILRHLIRHNKSHHNADIHFLLDIPAIQGIAHKDHNRVLGMALRQGHVSISKRLLALPDVKKLAGNLEHYTTDLRLGGITLQQLGIERASSEEAATPGRRGIFARRANRHRTPPEHTASCCVCM